MRGPLRPAFIVEKSEPGATTGRLVMLDSSIVVDPCVIGETVRWWCDHCRQSARVTAQFKHDHGDITLCAVCLQRGIDGIDHSLANPVEGD